MSDVQYPFIDVAVHERVREAFAAGMAVVLFSADLRSVSWANGRGAALFGFGSIYDFLDQGLDRGELMFRQVEPVARSLQSVGDRRTFTVRIASGFLRVAVQARCEMIRVQDKPCILLSVPVDSQNLPLKECAARLIEGFDDPDTHMAVLDGDGNILAASGQFAALTLSIQTTRMLVSMVGNDRHRLIKRPIATASGYLPAAIGQVSEEPALNLLFVVGAAKMQAAAVNATHAAEEIAADSVALPDYEDALSAVAAIEDNPETEEEISLDDTTGAADESDAAYVETGGHETETEADAFAETAAEKVTVEEASDTPSPVSRIEDIESGDVKTEDLAPADEANEVFTESGEPDAKTFDGTTAAERDAETVAQDISAEEIVSGENRIPADLSGDADVAVDIETDDDEVATFGSHEEHDDETVPATTSEAEAPGDEGINIAEDHVEPLPHMQQAEPASRPLGTVRFVWKIDAAGRFSEVSKEFAQAVGPHAADISGMAFSDLAALFNLDPDGKIGELLGRRDTWSGKTIWWPVEGTSLVVPVDLAALPTYTRAREFDGFRGFGIVRMGDAAEDPHAAGLSLGGAEADLATKPLEAEQNELQASEQLEEVLEQPAENQNADTVPAASDENAETAAFDEIGDTSNEEADVEASSFADDDMPMPGETDNEPDVDTVDADTAEDPAKTVDWPEGEPPALTLTETPGRRQWDKVIQLEERRSRLSPGEQANFQEIARRLDDFVKPAEDLETESDEALGDKVITADTTASDLPEDVAAFSKDVTSTNEDLVSEANGEVEQSLPTDDDETQQVDEELPEDAQAFHEDETLEVTDGSETSDNIVVTLFDNEPTEATEDRPENEIEHEEAVDAAALAAMLPGRDRTGLSEDIIDQMPVALLVHAGDRLIHANGEFLKLTGYPSLEALGDVGGLDALLQRQELEDKTTHAGGMVVVRADDVIVPVTARLQSIRFNETSALMLALMPVAAEAEPPENTTAEVLPLRPIRTADQLAKLQVEVEELRAILETATDGVVIIGSDREVRSMNRAASALFNFDGEEINGKPFVTLFAHESQRAILDYLSGISGHGVASVLNDGREVIGREASGGFLPLFMTIGRLTSSNGYCAVIRDITQWKRTEDELRTAKRAAETANAHKSEFLAHVSHEIRTPLNAIIGFADMMASERLGPVGHPRYIEYSNDIGRSGRHVLDIVNDLLDISKIEAGELDLDFVAVGLDETVSEAVSLVQPQANGQRVIIRTALSQAVPQVVADLRSIKQIVLNILSNAIRFTPSGGQIVVSTAYETNGSVVLRIRDTGIGMNRAELELAMKPFRQVAGASRKRGDGTGLGLPLTKAMVDANRANFAITSVPNEGTLVEITFPSQRVLAS
ncbi:PAS domain S-box-containing protein [Rhizobium cellulosilyticum]|uniref:histidine kinase n=2 Tax=Aliirhizobium cellulosilyticum TaxID=393664 RepID=A0A7W6WPR5_9HYPH|nr:ATP-binding protein [Rhizobium cellulosilyticum]MBB4348617.1 PAS domain S-box-containing protein [Rhizobium cellulosilyticum]MBB4411853.1 PAS domain S-box-containing protein [Rhizobium cellulosilyticum]MBB4446544.1 PAS domain S-box-containing protein [Rhizobium cellulosilyticum]